MTGPDERAPLSADALPATGAWRVGDPVGASPFRVGGGRPALRPRRRWTAAEHRESPTRRGVSSRPTRRTRCWCVTRSPAIRTRPGRVGSATRHRVGGTVWLVRGAPSTPIATSSFASTCSADVRGPPGRSSIDPETGKPYGSSLPGDHDPRHGARRGRGGRSRSASIVGWPSSAVRWVACRPSSGPSCIRIACDPSRAMATTAAASAQQIAWSGVQRTAIALDPQWRGGDYYDAAPGDGPHSWSGPGSRDRADHLPQRRRVQRPIRSGHGRPDRRRLHAVAAVRRRGLPRLPRRQIGAPLRCQLVPGDQPGHGSARHRTRTRGSRRCAASRRRTHR